MSLAKASKEEVNSSSKLFILVSCMDGKIDSTFEKIKQIASVVQVEKTEGAYDLIVILESEPGDNLKKTALQKIRTIDDVKYTLTLRSIFDNEVLG